MSEPSSRAALAEQPEAARNPLDEALGTEFDREDRRPAALFFRGISFAIDHFNAVLMTVLISAVSMNVVGRYLFNTSLPWAEELSRMIFVWTIFLGATAAFVRSEHIAVDYLVLKLPWRAAYAVDLLKSLVILVVLGFVLMGAREVLATFPGRTAILGVPVAWINASVPVAATIMGLCCLYRAQRALRFILRGGPAPEGGR